MYPPSMLSSAALAHSAQEMQRENLLGDLEFSVQQLINRLQILTRVENVSRKLQTILCHQYFAEHDSRLCWRLLCSAQTSFIDTGLYSATNEMGFIMNITPARP